jgi:hypothetical protein
MDTVEKKCGFLFMYFIFRPLLGKVCAYLTGPTYVKVLTDSSRFTGFRTPSKSPVLLLSIIVLLSCKI